LRSYARRQRHPWPRARGLAGRGSCRCLASLACVSSPAISRPRAVTATFNASASSGFPTHFGKHRAILVCSSCRGGAIRLFGHYGNYGCGFAHGAHYLPKKQKPTSRKRLTAAKLRLSVGGWPDPREPLPLKPKWKHRKRHQSICNQIQVLEAQANKTRFRKQI